MDAGLSAFAQKPFSAVNLKKDILEPAGVSVGSFYHQFKDKGELLVAILEEHSEAMRRKVSDLHLPNPDRSPETIARESYGLVFDLVDQHSDIVQIQLRGGDPVVNEFAEEDRQRWHDSRVADYRRLADAYGIEIDVEFAADVVGMLIDGAIRRYLSIPREERTGAREHILCGLVQLTVRGWRGLAGPDRN